MPAYPGVDIGVVNVNTDILTNAGASDLVVTVNVLNRNAEAAAIKLHVVVAAGAAGPANAIEWGRQIAGGDAFDVAEPVPVGFEEPKISRGVGEGVATSQRSSRHRSRRAPAPGP